MKRDDLLHRAELEQSEVGGGALRLAEQERRLARVIGRQSGVVHLEAAQEPPSAGRDRRERHLIGEGQGGLGGPSRRRPGEPPFPHRGPRVLRGHRIVVRVHARARRDVVQHGRPMGVELDGSDGIQRAVIQEQVGHRDDCDDGRRGRALPGHSRRNAAPPRPFRTWPPPRGSSHRWWRRATPARRRPPPRQRDARGRQATSGLAHRVRLAAQGIHTHSGEQAPGKGHRTMTFTG